MKTGHENFRPMVLILEMDQAELAVSMYERASGRRRPDGYSAVDLLDDIEPGVRVIWLKAADAAKDYLLRQLRGDGAEH